VVVGESFVVLLRIGRSSRRCVLRRSHSGLAAISWLWAMRRGEDRGPIPVSPGSRTGQSSDGGSLLDSKIFPSVADAYSPADHHTNGAEMEKIVLRKGEDGVQEFLVCHQVHEAPPGAGYPLVVDILVTICLDSYRRKAPFEVFVAAEQHGAEVGSADDLQVLLEEYGERKPLDDIVPEVCFVLVVGVRRGVLSYHLPESLDIGHAVRVESDIAAFPVGPRIGVESVRGKSELCDVVEGSLELRLIRDSPSLLEVVLLSFNENKFKDITVRSSGRLTVCNGRLVFLR